MERGKGRGKQMKEDVWKRLILGTNGGVGKRKEGRGRGNYGLGIAYKDRRPLYTFSFHVLMTL